MRILVRRVCRFCIRPFRPLSLLDEVGVSLGAHRRRLIDAAVTEGKGTTMTPPTPSVGMHTGSYASEPDDSRSHSF